MSIRLTLTPLERQALLRLRDTVSKPYLRERAAAMLKIAQGSSARQVALHHLLKPHKEETVREWLHRYSEQGIEGLKLRPGRGRKPASPPGGHR